LGRGGAGFSMPVPPNGVWGRWGASGDALSPQFISDVLDYIRHMVAELLDFLWHYLCWQMIRAMTYP
jgi:hypothetical protein